VLHGAELIEATKDVYWDIRPRPGFGTIEFRICDVPGRFSEMLGLVALVRAMVLDALVAIDRDPKLREGNRETYWLAAENRWLASRYGLQTPEIREPGMARVTLAEDIDNLLEQLAPTFQTTGDGSFVHALQDLKHGRTGTELQRHIYRETGSWRAVLDSMNRGWIDELAATPPRGPQIAAPFGIPTTPAHSK
jgi:carboxylate-amine ligase